jgi:hypothetical protein
MAARPGYLPGGFLPENAAALTDRSLDGYQSWRVLVLASINAVFARISVQDGRSLLGLFPGFLPAKGGQVKERVETRGVLIPAPEGRVGVEYTVSLAQEAAVPGHLGGLVAAQQLGLGPVVVVQLSGVPVQGDLKVIVEVAAVRGVPGYGPPPAGPEGLQLVQRCPRYKRDVPRPRAARVREAVNTDLRDRLWSQQRP